MSRIPRGTAWWRKYGTHVALVTCWLAAWANPARAEDVTGGLAGKIDPIFARWDRKDGPGVIVGVARDGKVVHARGYGLANLEHNVPLTADSVSESGSVAKQFTAAAVALLAVRGQLSLDDSIRKYLPELRPVMDGVTVRMLLNHTGGVRDIHGIFELLARPSYSSFHTNAEVLRVMARQRDLNFAPGTEYAYSNGGYILAALIVERVAKTTLGAFCREQIFVPRGMNQTQWREDFAAVVPRRAAGYEPRPGGGYRIDMPYSNLVGNGGLLTTVGDLLTWNTSLDRAKGEWGEVVKLLQTRSKLKDGRELDYGLGLSVDEHAGFVEIAHGGATSGYRTYLARFPTRGLSVALLGNTAEFNGQIAAHRIAEAVLELKPAARPRRVELASEEVARYAGLYHSAKTDALLTFTNVGGKLMLNGAEAVPVGPRTFTTGGGAVTYVFGEANAEGRPSGLTARTTNAETTFVAAARATPERLALNAYAGTYYSEELGVAKAVVVSDGKLALTQWPGASATGEATFVDGFWFGRGWHATFVRGEEGRVIGMELTNSSGRCRRMKFVRR